MKPTFPPGPKSLTTVIPQFLHDSCAYYERCLRRYGDPFTLPTPFGPLVVTAEPEGAREIFSAGNDVFEVFAPSAVEPLFGPTSILISSGEVHRADRKLLLPAFQKARIGSYSQVIADVATESLRKLTPGVVFSGQEAAHDIALEVILRGIFGPTEPRFHELLAAVHATQTTTTASIVFVPALRREFLGFGPWSRFQRAVNALDELLFEVVTRRRKAGGGKDILGALVEARYEDGTAPTDARIRDQILSLIGAGHETVASGIAWALFWLHHEPRVLARLLEELDTCDPDGDLGAYATLPYMEAVCSEVLRTSPILPEITRNLRKPFTFRGYELPAKAAVGVFASLMHMREDLYPDPRAFRPERFLERKYSPFEFVTFGGGNRRCIGSFFAAHEMKIVLAALLTRGRFELAGPVERTGRASLPVTPKYGVKLRYLGRRRPRVRKVKPQPALRAG